MKLFWVKDVESTVIGAGQGTSRQVLISPEQGPNFAMRKFVMQPGGDIPAHTNAVEHEQYVLGGRAQIGIGDEVYNVEKDDVVFIPAGVPHWWFRATSLLSFCVLCRILKTR